MTPQKSPGNAETLETFERNLQKLQERAEKLNGELPDNAVVNIGIRWREFKDRSEKLQTSMDAMAGDHALYEEGRGALEHWVEAAEETVAHAQHVSDLKSCAELMDGVQVRRCSGLQL